MRTEIGVLEGVRRSGIVKGRLGEASKKIMEESGEKMLEASPGSKKKTSRAFILV